MKPAGLAKRQYIDYLDCQNVRMSLSILPPFFTDTVEQADPAPLMDDCDGVIASLASYNELLVRRFQLHKSFPEDFGKQNREANYDYKIVEPGYCHEAVQGTCAAYVCAICDELDVHTTDWANFLQTINSDCVTNGQEGTISDDILYTVGITYNPVELPMYTCSFPHADGPQYFPAQPNLTNGAKKRKALPPA